MGNTRQITACITWPPSWACSAPFSSSLPCSTARFRVWHRLPCRRTAMPGCVAQAIIGNLRKISPRLPAAPIAQKRSFLASDEMRSRILPRVPSIREGRGNEMRKLQVLLRFLRLSWRRRTRRRPKAYPIPSVDPEEFSNLLGSGRKAGGRATVMGTKVRRN
jgi:hypothetical protein